MKRVLVFSTVQLWQVHHSDVVELIWRLTNEGKQVLLISCDGNLSSCPANSGHNRIKCFSCREVTTYTESKLLPDSCIPLRLTLKNVNLSFEIDDLRDLLNLKFNNMPIGRLVASQIADDVNGVYLNLQNYYIKKKVLTLIKNGIDLYLETVNLVKEHGIEEVYTWNGRRPSDGPPLYAAEFLKKDFFSFISGGKTGYLHIVNSKSVQEPVAIRNQIDIYKNMYNKNKISKIGKRHFTSDIHHEIDQIGFRKFNSKVIKPRSIASDKQILLVVTSSPTESIHLSEHFDFYGDSPYETLISILNDTRVTDKYRVVIRWHPAKANANTDDKKVFKTLWSTNEDIIHIRPEEGDDTYDLVRESAVVLSFGSTVGFVAALSGKPVVLAGPMAGVFEEAFYCARNAEEARNFLLTDLKPKNTEEIELYGYYCANFGSKMKYIEIEKVGSKYNAFLLVSKKKLLDKHRIPLHPKSIIKVLVNKLSGYKGFKN